MTILLQLILHTRDFIFFSFFNIISIDYLALGKRDLKFQNVVSSLRQTNFYY